MTTERKSNEIHPSKDYYQKNNLALDSWFKIALKDYQELVNNNDFLDIINSFGNDQINLLDIGCGTGVFPKLLDQKIDTNISFLSDLLDISQYCLDECGLAFNKLQHFQTNQIFLSSTEDIKFNIPKSNYYDLIWAIHSFYTVDLDKIKDILKHIRELLKPNGIFLMYQASVDSSYNQLYDFYLDNYKKPHNSKRFLRSEDVQASLDRLKLNYGVVDFDYNHEVDSEDKNLLEIYLKKCILDSSINVLSLFKEKINEYFQSTNKKFIFNQQTKLIIFKK